MLVINGERAAQLSHATTALGALFEPLDVEVEIGKDGFRGPVAAMDGEHMIMEPVEVTGLDGRQVDGVVGGRVTAPVRGATVRIF